MKSVLPTATRAAVTLLAIAGSAGHVAYLDTLWWHTFDLTDTVARDVSPGLVLLLSSHAVVSVVSAVFAVALVLHEGPRHAAARSLGTAFGAWAYLMAYSGVIMLFRPDPGPLRDLFEAHFLLVEMVGLIGLIRFTALFPEPLVPDEIEPSPTMPQVLMPFHLASVWMLRASVTWGVALGVLVVLWAITVASGAPVGDAGLSRSMNAVRLLAAGLVVLNLRRSWGRTDAEGHARLRWLLAALVVLMGAVSLMIGGNVLVAVAEFGTPDVAWQPLVIDVGLVGFLSCLALSVLYGGPITASTVVRRVTAVATILTLGLFLAAGLEGLLSGGVLAAFSLRTGVGTALAAATIVSSFRGLERLVDRLLPEV